jgi:hypothetical protein
MQNKRIQFWALNISAYNCKIEYLPGKLNLNADFFSRPLADDKNANMSDIELYEPDINDNAFEITVSNSNYNSNYDNEHVVKTDESYEVNALDSTHLDAKQKANKKYQIQEPIVEDIKQLEKLNMSSEQDKDQTILELKMLLRHGQPTKSVHSKYLKIDQVLYYLSNVDDSPNLGLFVPQHLKHLVITQYHLNNGHPGTQRLFTTIKQKYFWPKMFKELYEYVSKCVDCQSRNLTK